MSRERYYDDVKIIKKPLKKRIKKFLVFFAIIFMLVGIIISSFYISKSITVGKLGSIFVYGDTSFKISESKMYIVSLGKYASKDEAEKVSLGATIQGASGFVWESGNEYIVVGSMYENLSDAESVKNNLSNTASNYSISIEEIKFPKITLNFDEYDNKDVAEIKNAVEFCDTLYSDLYNYSIKLDKKEINNLAISSEISALRGKLKSYINKIQSILSLPNAKLSVIQNSLIAIDELLDTAILRTIDNTGLNYYIKSLFVNVARIKYDMMINLK